MNMLAPIATSSPALDDEIRTIHMGRAIRGFRSRKDAVQRLEACGYSHGDIMAYSSAAIAREVLRQIRSGERSGVVTKYNPPPIPYRDRDWWAVEDDYEPGDPIGAGPTEFSAVQDLIDQMEQRDD